MAWHHHRSSKTLSAATATGQAPVAPPPDGKAPAIPDYCVEGDTREECQVYPRAKAHAGGARAQGTQFTRRQVILVFIGLMLAMFTSSLSETITATALPTIVGDLGGVEIMQWVTTAYIMASTIMMPIYGKLGDLIGRKYLLMSALAIYIVGCAICGLAPNMAFLIIGRSVAGLGGGGLIILSQAIIADVVSARDRGKYLGIMGSVFAVSTVLGPLLGGWFVQVTGWRWLFAFNIPLAVVAIITDGFVLKQDRPSHRPSIDYWGIVTMVATIATLVLITSWAGSVYPFDSPIIIGLIIGFAIACTLFVLVERRAAQPIIPLSLFANKNFRLVTITGLLVELGLMGTTSYMPTYLQIVHDLPPELAGLMTCPMMGGVLITSTATGFIASKTGHYKWMPIASCAVAACGFFLLSTMTAQTSLFMVGLYLFCLGFGIGLGLQILVLIVQNEFPHSMVGTATAGNNFFRQIGGTLGASLVGTLFTARLTANLAGKLPASAHISVDAITPELMEHLSNPLRQTIATGYSDALTPIFLYLVPLILIGFVLTCFVTEHPLATKVDNAGTGASQGGSAASAQSAAIPARAAASASTASHTSQTPPPSTSQPMGSAPSAHASAHPS